MSGELHWMRTKVEVTGRQMCALRSDGRFFRIAAAPNLEPADLRRLLDRFWLTGNSDTKPIPLDSFRGQEGWEEA